MEVSSTKLGTFTLFFPHQLHNQANPVSGTDQREHVFIGEEFDINIVAKSDIDPVENSQELTKWKCTIQALQPIVTVVSSQNLKTVEIDEPVNQDSNFIHCKPLASYKERLKDRKWLQLNSTTQVYPIRASFADLPINVTKCKVWVTLWGPAVDIPERKDLHGLKECMAKYPDIPDDALQQDGKILRQVVIKEMQILPQPKVDQMYTCNGGRQYVSLRVMNPLQSKVDICSVNLKLIMESEGPDEEAGFSLDPVTCVDFPVRLMPLESHVFMYRMLVSEAEVYSDLSVPLSCEVEWSSTRHTIDTMHTRYSLPCVKLRRPPMLITIAPEEKPQVGKPFRVTYTIHNELQDFLSLKLVWSPEKALTEQKVQQCVSSKRALQEVLESVICHHPTSLLGPCGKGMTMTVPIDFEVLKPGIYEIGQHMKLNLQYYNPHPLTASLMAAQPSDPNHRGKIPNGGGMPGKGSTGFPQKSSPQHRRTSSLSPAVESKIYHGNPPPGVTRTGSASPVTSHPPSGITTPRTGSSSPVTPHPGLHHPQQQQPQQQQGRNLNPASHVVIGGGSSRNPSAANSPAPTPTDLSPVHGNNPAAAAAALKGVNIDSSRHFGSPATRHKFLAPYGPRSISQMNSPMSPKHVPTGPVLPHQVLKRNCQIYVTAALN